MIYSAVSSLLQSITYSCVWIWTKVQRLGLGKNDWWASLIWQGIKKSLFFPPFSNYVFKWEQCNSPGLNSKNPFTLRIKPQPFSHRLHKKTEWPKLSVDTVCCKTTISAQFLQLFKSSLCEQTQRLWSKNITQYVSNCTCIQSTTKRWQLLAKQIK